MSIASKKLKKPIFVTHEPDAHIDLKKLCSTIVVLRALPPDLKARAVAVFGEYAANFPGYVECHLIEDGELAHVCLHFNTDEGVEGMALFCAEFQNNPGRSLRREYDAYTMKPGYVTEPRPRRAKKKATAKQNGKGR